MFKFSKYIFCFLLVLLLISVTTNVVFAQEQDKSISIVSKVTLTDDDWNYIDSLPFEQRQELLLKRIYNIKQEPTLREIAVINNMSIEELVTFIKQQQEQVEYFRNNGEAIFTRNNQVIIDLFKNNPDEAAKRYPKMSTDSTQSSQTEMKTLSVIPIGTYGDILVSYGISSWAVITGHAGIVSLVSSTLTVESWPGFNSPIGVDGVQYYTNNWGSYSMTFGFGVTGATTSQYQNSASYAQNQVGKPFNLVFINKFDTSRFYCSSLVWRAWDTQGYNVDGTPIDTWVTPADITNDFDVFLYYFRP